ncbi:MAG: ABC transporter G family protein [Cytophagales bacterium]|jgi:ABC-type multidrug transport system ATPase subunit|nr:ATP-binding cassette domain-containing protein [Bacteroidota bacterium]MBS1981652.1 ATP-binding cassette domain-containing protein [Bacteroidota bacterium]WHZ08962.1 MAG: ABC transporter G family protein [Cytophagales bacterium]
MSEELLKAIIQFFAIVAKERITEDERTIIKEFLSLHLNQDRVRYYLSLFDEFCKKNNRAHTQVENVDQETQEFVDDWAQIIQIARKVNQALTTQQKAVLVIKVIELVFAGNELSERQSNLIFYIGEALKIPAKDIKTMRAFVLGHDVEEFESKNILIIDESESVGNRHEGPHLTAKNISGMIAILRLPNIETYFIKYLGITPLYLNSLPLKSRKVDVLPTGSTLRGSKIEPIYYSDIVGKFLSQENRVKVSFIADHIFYHFKSGRAGLQNVSIAENGGKLIGIMGGSGSGKSTLLNVLNGTEKPSSGQVLINGINVHEQPHLVEGVIGYIPQDDLLMEDLSVYENLYYAAQLCFAHYTTHQIIEKVDNLLSNLNLTDIKDLKVGSALQKIISGGQRKRLNIGLELLREPTILFVDEPTSGLSSRDSENIMDLLKELTLRGKMIFVVIHQPSSDIFKMFDSLLIFDLGGFQIYYGNPVESVNYFQDIINAANRSPGACPECGNINPEQVFNIIETRVVNEYGHLTRTRKVSPGQWYQYFKKKIKIPKIEEYNESLPAVQQIPQWFQQLRTFVVRDIKSKLANRQYVTINLLLAPLLALFIGYFVEYFDYVGIDHPHYSFYDNANIPVYFFMSIVVALFVGLIVSAEEIFRDRKILKRERFLHLSRSSYFVSKLVILFSISAIQTVTFVLVGNALLEIPLTEMRYWLILFSCSCFANVLGLNISSAFDSAVTIYVLIPILIIPQLLLSGVVISFDKFNPKVGSPNGIPILGELMTSRWAFEAYMVTQFKDNPLEKIFYPIDQKRANAEYKRGYYLPELESRLAYVVNHPMDWRNSSDNSKVNKSLNLLRNELTFESGFVGKGIPEINNLSVGKFDSATYLKVSEYLRTLKSYYSIRIRDAVAGKEKMMAQFTNDEAKKVAFEKLKLKYQNAAVTKMVENTESSMRVVEWDGELIQKIYPIYFNEHRPEHFFDFRDNFYIPTKYFAGQKFDTLYFNLTVIWVMVIILYATLYFELLKKAVHGFNMRRRYGKKSL